MLYTPTKSDNLYLLRGIEPPPDVRKKVAADIERSKQMTLNLWFMADI